MLQSWSCEAMDSLARSQWRLYAGLGDQMQIDAEERRRVLLLDQRQWSDWEDFLRDGPLPTEPSLPVMLRRLGSASHHLALRAELQDATA
jgi:hypothetical protein